MGRAKLGRGRGPFSQQNQLFGWKSIPGDLERLAATGARRTVSLRCTPNDTRAACIFGRRFSFIALFQNNKRNKETARAAATPGRRRGESGELGSARGAFERKFCLKKRLVQTGEPNNLLFCPLCEPGPANRRLLRRAIRRRYDRTWRNERNNNLFGSVHGYERYVR